MDLKMRQRGRASLEFAASLSIATNDLNRRVATELRDLGLDEEALVAGVDERLEQVAGIASDSGLYRASTLSADWLWANHGRISIECLEEILPDVQEGLEALDEGPSTISAREGFEPPDYFSRQWFHNTTGGWDGHRFMGTIQSEFVHKHYVAAKYGAGLYELRRRLLDQLPDHEFSRIFEMGTSAGYFTCQLADKFPHAEIVGCDLSQRMLEQARRIGNERGCSWRLLLAPAEDTGLESESFDLVVSYALLHEMPGEAILQAWQEAFRLLRPGGYALMADGIPSLHDVDRLTGWRFTHDWLRGGEPYARDYATMDDAACAQSVGFIEVDHRGLDGSKIPRFTLARKPSAGDAA